MTALVLTLAIVLAVLVGSEALWRTRSMHDEFSRKFVHITIGSFVAFWPFYLSWHAIELVSLAFFLVVLISKYLNVFRAIHSVQRPTWGELLFALAVGGIALVTHNKWIYMTALLQMSLADGLAAVVGIRYGKRQRYHIFGHAKSVVGTLAFFLISLLLLVGYTFWAPSVTFSPVLLVVAVLATVVENFGIYGFDNLLVPLLVAAALRLIG